MDMQSDFYGNQLSNLLLRGSTQQTNLYAVPVNNTDSLSEDLLFDLNRVKLEPEALDSGLPMDTKPDLAQLDAQIKAPVPGKTHSKRGRKPQLTAYGKVGEKLEKRREQNRRAATTYRNKQKDKRREIEETYAVEEAKNIKQKKENDQLRAKIRELEAILQAHKNSAQCCLHNNNNNTIAMPSDGSFFAFNPNFNPHQPNVQFQNPMMSFAQQDNLPSRDQTVTSSPFTPKTDQVFFSFDNLDCGKQQTLGTSPQPMRLSSPGSVLSASPEPPAYPYNTTTTTALPAISTVYGNAHSMLDDDYLDAVDDFILEQLNSSQ